MQHKKGQESPTPDGKDETGQGNGDPLDGANDKPTEVSTGDPAQSGQSAADGGETSTEPQDGLTDAERQNMQQLENQVI